MITKEEIAKCWRPEDVITLLTRKRQQLKEKVKLTFMRAGITDKKVVHLLAEHRGYVLEAIDKMLCVEGEK